MESSGFSLILTMAGKKGMMQFASLRAPLDATLISDEIPIKVLLLDLFTGPGVSSIDGGRKYACKLLW
jgi:hypothetical protein